MYDKQIRVDPGISFARAITCLDKFLAEHGKTRHGCRQSVAYHYIDDHETIIVYQSPTAYIVRKG